MLLDLEQLKQNFISKLENKNYDFDDTDIMMLKIDSDLRKKFFAASRLDQNLFTDKVVTLFDEADELTQELIDEPFLLEAYAKACIRRGDCYVVTGIREYVDEEVAQKILNYFLEWVDKNDSVIDVGYNSNEFVELILDTGKIDVLYRLNNCKELSDTVVPRLREAFKGKDRVPDFFAMKYKEFAFDYSKYSLIGLLKVFQEMYESTGPFYTLGEESQNNLQQLYDIIYERIMSRETFDLKQFKDALPSSFIKFDSSKKSNLVETLIKTVGVIPSVMSAVEYELGEYLELIVSHITENADFGLHCGQSDLSYQKRILDKLLEFGLIDQMVYFSGFDDYIPVIIDKIKSEDPAFKDKVFKSYDKYKRNLSLFKLLMERGMLEDIHFNVWDFGDIKGLREIVLNEIKQGHSVNFDVYCYEFEGFLEAIIKNRNFSTLLNTNINSLDNAKLSEEAINILIEELKVNIALADKILSKARCLIFQNPAVLSFYLQSTGYLIEAVINRINHEESLAHLYNEDTYNLVKDYYAEKYSLNLNHLDLMSAKFGMKIIRYLDNENIHGLVNLSDEEFNKFIALFPDEKMQLNDISNIYDSIMQYKFSKEHPEVVNIFADIMHSLEDNDNVYIKRLEELYSVFSDKFYGKFAESYPDLFEQLNQDPKKFLLELVNRIQNKLVGYDRDIDVLHFITNYYIANKREEYREGYDMYGEKSLAIPYDLDKNDIEKKLVEVCLKEYQYRRYIVKKLMERGLSDDLANSCIYYFLSKKDKSSTEKDVEVRIFEGSKMKFSLEEVKQIRKHLRELSLISKEYVKVMSYRDYYIRRLDEQRELERIYRAPEVSQDFYQLLSGMNVGALKHTLASPEVYQSLLQTMHKYRIHHIPAGFKEILESEYIGISGDYGNLSGFISYYDKIYESERSRLASQGKLASNLMLKPVNIFIYGDVYSSVSSVYSQVLGSTDAKLIKANPKNNEATRKTAGNTRLNEAVEWTISNFRRMSITIPSFAENVPLESGKTMYAVVGNFTNPSNVTHGERTGACMRIGGVGETLFQFCLKNENGFHIRFENPVTGEYISRVSGFRNGNTVFLNELRNSCNFDDYSNDEVVEACRRVAELLIEKSKDSACPIENVVVSTEYAVDKNKYHKTNLGVSNIKNGLPPFYSDVSTSAHILATSATTSKFVPLDFDKSKVPTYLPAREKAKESTNLKELIDMINRVDGVKSLLAGKPLESIEPVIVDDSFVYGIASQDWYIYVDDNFEVHEDIISIDPRAKEELAIARKRVEEMLPVVEKQHAYMY